MDLVVHLNGEIFRVRIEGASVQVDGVAVDVDLASAGLGPVRSARVAGQSLRVLPRRGARGEWRLDVDGVDHLVEVLDPGEASLRQIRRKGADPVGTSLLRAPMPGLIVQVEVAPGEWVEAGQGAVRMEAMKMENELSVPRSGTVLRVLVSAGDTVERDQVLMEFESSEGDR